MSIQSFCAGLLCEISATVRCYKVKKERKKERKKEKNCYIFTGIFELKLFLIYIFVLKSCKIYSWGCDFSILLSSKSAVFQKQFIIFRVNSKTKKYMTDFSFIWLFISINLQPTNQTFQFRLKRGRLNLLEQRGAQLSLNFIFDA